MTRNRMKLVYKAEKHFPRRYFNFFLNRHQVSCKSKTLYFCCTEDTCKYDSFVFHEERSLLETCLLMMPRQKLTRHKLTQTKTHSHKQISRLYILSVAVCALGLIRGGLNRGVGYDDYKLGGHISVRQME